MKFVVGLGATIFVAMAVVVAIKLSGDFLPAKHLDVSRSAYFLDGNDRAWLVLVVRDVAPDGTPHLQVLPPQGEGQDAIVELRTALRAPTTPEHEGTVTVDSVVPRAAHLTVLDRRWGHSEHPEGHRFALQEKPPAGWTSSGTDRP